MTADPTPWFARTVGMSRADVAFAAEMMVFTLADAVDQSTFDSALHTALTLLYGEVAEWEADLLDEPAPMVPTQRKEPCPTCMGPSRETVGMVCQTCGTDYGVPTQRGGAS